MKMNETTFKVYQRSGNRWVCVGTFVEVDEPVRVKEGLYRFLQGNGITYRPHKWSVRR
jgi:hypothetical protein